MQESQPSLASTKTAGQSRGKTILAFGITSLFLIPISMMIAGVFVYTFESFPRDENGVYILVNFLLYIVAIILGISAWNMGNKDLKKTSSRILPSLAIGCIKTGKILGIFGLLLHCLMFVWAMIPFFGSASIGISKEAMTEDLKGLLSDAYRYRTSPASSGGGEGTYAGYVIHPTTSRTEYAAYEATVVHADTVQFEAVCFVSLEAWFPNVLLPPLPFGTKLFADSTRTISVTIDSTGRPAGTWKYGRDYAPSKSYED
jgi:hypothetical protein